MDKILTNPQEWVRIEGGKIDTKTGVVLGAKDQKDLCTYYGIPASLINVDKKFQTNTLCTVLQAATEEVEIVTDGENHHVLDPKSVFVEDDMFTSVTELVQESTGVDPTTTKGGLVQVAEFVLPDLESDSFLGDVFKRKVRIERLPQGGLTFNTAALRLACTNGMVVADSQYTKVLRDGQADSPVVHAFVDAVQHLNMDQYLNMMFTKDGRPIDATVADWFAMRSMLLQLSKNEDVENDKGDESLVDTLFPTQVIEDFYAKNGIDFKTINRKLLERLPSGMSYYNCWNILTNGAKHVEQTLDNHIKIASFIRPSRMRQINLVTPDYQGTPEWTGDYNIKRLMGDLV